MSGAWVFLGYGLALAAALLLLYRFKALAWYWHVISLAAAVSLGFVPPPQGWSGPTFDLLFGVLFCFLMVWGLGGVLMFRTHHPKHTHA